MENLDLTVLRALRDWRRAGHHALMATVVRTWGSSPRPVGSIMALCDSGAVVGSVSGGCIEDDLIAGRTSPRGMEGTTPAPRRAKMHDESIRRRPWLSFREFPSSFYSGFG